MALAMQGLIMGINWGTINWAAFLGSAVAICIFIGPFAYRDRRAEGGTHCQAVLAVVLVFALVFLWIAGASSIIYGIGVVIDNPAQPLGSGGYLSAETHLEPSRAAYILLGLGLMAAAFLIGKVCELRR
jgi:hypothetical protein